jgi:fermentation-respiration switch protein FrsA (DUF1100 family)
VLFFLAFAHPLRPLVGQAAASTSERCYDGIVGTATQARRAILVRRADSTTLEFYGRPSRSVPLLASPDSASAQRWHSAPSGSTRYSVRVAADSAMVESVGASRVSTGVLHQASASPSFAALAGDWETELGPGGILRLIVRMSLGPCGRLVGTLDSPDQGQRDLPLTHVQAVRDSLVIEARYFGLRMAFARTEPGGATELRGTFSQNGTLQSLVLRRSAGALTMPRPQDPVGPRPYVEREVQFSSASTGVRLAGILTVPRGGGPHPAVVLISGSGAQDRDESIAGHRPFLVLADHLTKSGFAVLRTDDRGIGASTGRVIDARLEDLADDVHGALSFLRSLPEIDAERLGVLGHSEGGYVAPLVATRDTTVRFVVLLAGPAVSGRSLLLAQHVALMRAAADPPEVIRVDSAMLHAIFDVIDRRPAAVDLAPMVDSAVGRWLRGLSPGDRRIATAQLQQRSAAQDSASIALWNSVWFRSFYFHDPVSTLGTMRTPVLALFGERDLQVPAQQSVTALRRLFTGPRTGLLTARVMGGLNHLMQPAATGLMEEYRRIDTTMSPTVLDAIASWLRQTVSTVPPGGRR